jgi:hypothetical protein
MYKLSIKTIQGLLNSFEKTNVVLKKLSETNDSLSIQESIRENEKQIKILKSNYNL